MQNWIVTEARGYVMNLVHIELARQIALKKSGKFTHTCEDLADRPHEALPILLEEFGEVARAMQNGDKENLQEELVQVAAIAISWVAGLVQRDLAYVG